MEVLAEKTGCGFLEEVNIHHNYAAKEEHFGKKVMVHRKGATSARLNEKGIVPGSQGTSSYIVIGRGNKESFESCAHGAGRRMGREEAKRRLTLEEEQKRLDDQGIVHALRSRRDLDEAAGAYKNIESVINEQKNLSVIKTKLIPIGGIKG